MLPEQIDRLIEEHLEQTTIMAESGVVMRAALHRRTAEALQAIRTSWVPRRMTGVSTGLDYQEVPMRVKA